MRGREGYHKVGRRDLVLGGSIALVGCSARASAPLGTPGGTPEPAWGVQSGDVSATRAVVWSRSDRAATMVTEWATAPSFASPQRAPSVPATLDSDFTGKTVLEGLPSGTRIHYRVRFEGERPSPWPRALGRARRRART